MTKSAFRMLVGAGLLASALATATLPAAAATMELGRHNYWSAVVKTDGNGGGMVRTTFPDGSTVGVMLINGKVELVIDNPHWQLPQGSTYSIRIAVDGDAFSGTVQALDGTSVITTNLSKDFVRELYSGKQAEFTFGGERWVVRLNGFSVAMDELFAYYRGVTYRR